MLPVLFGQITLIQYRNLCMDNLTIKLPHKLHQIFSCQAAAQIHTHTQTEILTQTPSATLAINKQQIFYANFQFNTTLNAHWEGNCACVYLCLCVGVYKWIVYLINKKTFNIHTHTHTHVCVCILTAHLWLKWRKAAHGLLPKAFCGHFHNNRTHTLMLLDCGEYLNLHIQKYREKILIQISILRLANIELEITL